jgi:uncharacterized protein
LSIATSLKGNLAFDSSVLVEIFSDSELGRLVYTRLQQQDVEAYTSRINVAEATYVICRKVGHEKAQSAARDLLDSGFISPEDDPRIHTIASEIKCDRAISLADCYTFAVARTTSSVPVFARQEDELARESRKRPFETLPVFLS